MFGEAKGRHGLRRAKYRGYAQMQIQLYLTAITQNLKRLVGRLCALLGLFWGWFYAFWPLRNLSLCVGHLVTLMERGFSTARTDFYILANKCERALYFS